jgi:hypothetical protein
MRILIFPLDPLDTHRFFINRSDAALSALYTRAALLHPFPIYKKKKRGKRGNKKSAINYLNQALVK